MSAKITNAISTNDLAGGSLGGFPVQVMFLAGLVIVLGAGGLLWAARKPLFYPSPPEPDPADEATRRYESAKTLLGTNQAEEAAALLRTTLETMPEEARSSFLLAEIQAGHLQDVTAARETIVSLLRQPGLSIQVWASAQERLSEWHLAQGGTAEEACAYLKEIVQRFPVSDYAQAARQRIIALLGALPAGLEREATHVNLYRKN